MSILARTSSVVCIKRSLNSIRSFSAASASSSSSFTPFSVTNLPKPSWSLGEYQIEKSKNGNSSVSSSSVAVSHDDLVKLARLSYLDLPQDSTQLTDDVVSVVGWLDSITTLNMDQHEPMYSPLEVLEYYDAIKSTDGTSSSASSSSIPGTRLREDVVTADGMQEEVLSNAPFKHRGFFVVPKSGKLNDEDDN